jgi:hypothetical protein
LMFCSCRRPNLSQLTLPRLFLGILPLGVTDPQTPGPGGGLLTYVKADIPFRQIPSYREEEDEGGLEAFAVEIQRGARGKFLVTNLYMPPIREGGQGGFNPGAIRVPAPQFLLEGNFNAHSPLWDDSQPRDGFGTILEEWTMDSDLISLNDGSKTRVNRVTTAKSALHVTLVHNSLCGRGYLEAARDSRIGSLPIAL